MKYVKTNFFAARNGHEADDTRRELQRSIDEIANTRIHGTTHRRPIDLFADERTALLAIPDRRFELVTWHHGRVHLDTHVAFDKRLYSVPWPLIGQMVWVRATAERVALAQLVGLDERIGYLLGRAAGALALDNEDLALLEVAFLAVGELAG